MKSAICVLLAVLASASAFQRLPAFRTAKVATKTTLSAESTYWEDKPPSSVLGIGASIPSAVFGPLSIVAFIAGTYCIHESNIFNQITPTSINAVYIAGSALVPISWGMHVAAWIQKQNGK
mmetsp:Transcript_23706/g.23907  ORF Transcript_23706/g.23907 Transcript_23706/m.23907 type:complete len:121 (-) Transcript_23706:66-428(-)